MDSYSKNTRFTCHPSTAHHFDKTPTDNTRQCCFLQKGFPPGFTVDELKKHRKRRPESINKSIDNLQIEPGSFKYLKTEYNRRFVQPSHQESQNSVKQPTSRPWKMSDGGSIKMLGEYGEKFLEFPRERPSQCKPHQNLLLALSPMVFTTENLETFVHHKNIEKAKSLRRNTSLKLEGELATETETRHEFRPLGSSDRVRALKRPTNLKLEGLFESLTSEQKEKYIAYLASRPTVVNRGSQLKLDGGIDFSTECKEKYTYPGSQTRPLLRKRSTSLKLEGEVDFTPEYRKSFVELPRCRAYPVRPQGHLQSKGDLEMTTESRLQYLPGKLSNVPLSAKMQDSIRLTGDIALVPEYRQQFISHGKMKTQIIHRPDNLNLEGEVHYETENTKYSPTFISRLENTSSPHSAAPRALTSSSEYHSQFVDFPRGRPLVPKPTPNLLNAGQLEMFTESSKYGSFGTALRESITELSQKHDERAPVDGEFKSKLSYTRTPKPADMLADYQSFEILNSSESKKNIEPLQPHDPTHSFRLEIHNADDKPRGFHCSPERVFPRQAVTTNNKFASKSEVEAAVNAAMKRRSSHERNKVGKEGKLEIQNEKMYFDENDNESAFTVINGRHNSDV